MENNKPVQIYEQGSWLANNIQLYERMQASLQELDTRRDALPLGFKPRDFLQFLRGAVNEVKRVSAQNQALTEALKSSNKSEEK